MKEKSFWFGIVTIMIFMLFKAKYIAVAFSILWLMPPLLFKEDETVKGYFLGTGMVIIIQTLEQYFGA